MKIHAAIIVVFTFLLLSCASRSTQSPVPQVQNVQQTSRSGEVSELNSKLLSHSSSPSDSSTDYIIGPSDLLEVQVLESEKLDAKERVDSRGYVNLPLVDDVHVGGLTPVAAEERIEMLLKKGGYINNPHVNVFVLERKSSMVSVLGYVNEPGNYEIIGDMTLLDALAMANGLEKDAGKTVYISRNNGESNDRIIIDLDELFKKDGEVDAANFVLRQGDKIYVPEASNVFVDGAVVKPGSYPIQDGETTLSEAITMAGGLVSYADADDVSLIRYLDNNKREVSTFDLDSIRSGGLQDPTLNQKDTIVVGASGLKKFIYGFSFSFFGTGVGYNPPTR